MAPMAIDLSVVIPIRNEAPAIGELVGELTRTLTGWGGSFEIIVVDDGSTDESFEILARLQTGDARLRVIRFRRNFGQTAAFAAGFAHARGRLIATSDGDLQNDPRDIPAMIGWIEKGYDIVCGWRKNRQDTLSRRLPSNLANRLISTVTRVRLHDYGCTLKAYRREVLAPVRLYGEMHRFIPIYAAQQGARVTEVVVNHRPRVHGTTKYGLGRVPNVFLDLMLVQFLWKYGTKPMHVFGKFGLANIAGSFVTFALMLYFKLFGDKRGKALASCQGLFCVYAPGCLLRICPTAQANVLERCSRV